MFNRKTSRGVSRVQAGAMLAMAVIGVSSFAPRIQAANVVLNDTNLTLSDPNAWVGLVAPTGSDVAVLNNTLTGTTNSLFTWAVGAGTNNTFAGIQVLNPGGAIKITDAVNVLSLGSAGLDMSAATVNVTLNTSVNLNSATSAQTWSVGSGLTLAVNGTVSGVGNSLTLAGAGTVNVSGGFADISRLNQSGAGVLALSGTNTFAGIVGVTAGTVQLNFVAGSAPASNILASSSSLSLGGGTFQMIGSDVDGKSQTFDHTVIAAGATTNVTVSGNGASGNILNLGIIDMPNRSGQIVFNTSGTGTITMSQTLGTGVVLGNGGLIYAANSLGATNMYGVMGTYGLNDWAAAATSSAFSPGTWAIVPASSITGFYTTSGFVVGSGAANALNWDLPAGNTAVANTTSQIQTVRFNATSSSTLTLAPNFAAAGVLVTSNVGANNSLITGGNWDARPGGGGDEYLFVQNNTRGILTMATNFLERQAAGTVTFAGIGTTIVSGTTGSPPITGGFYLNGGFTVFTGSLTLGNATTSTSNSIFINGGFFVASTSYSANPTMTSSHPFVLSGMGGGIGAYAGTTLTLTNNTISGSAIAPLQIGFGTLTGTGAGTANPTPIIGSGTVVMGSGNTYSNGTNIVAGTVLVNTGAGNAPFGSGPITVGGTGTVGGTLSVSGNYNATNSININAGGFITATSTGTLAAAFTVNAGGTYLTGTGTVNSAITLTPGASIAGTGNDLQSRVIPAGVQIEPGTRATLGTINFQNLTLNSGSILNMTLRGIPNGSDIINILPGGSLTLSSNVLVNLYDINGLGSYFSNGSYQLFSGVDVLTAGKFVGSATQGVLTNFVAANFNPDNISGANASFSIVGGSTASSIWVTITGGQVISTWQVGGTSSGTDWTDPGSWSAGVPGNVRGDSAALPATVLPTTIALNNGTAGQHLGVLGMDAGTNSGWTLVGGTGALYMDNGTKPASIVVGGGANLIASSINILSPLTIAFTSSAGSLAVTGLINGPSASNSFAVSGPSTLTLSNANTIAGAGSVAANGTLQFGNGGATGSYGSGTLTDSGNVIIQRTGTYNLTSLVGGLLGAGTLTQGAAGQLIWNSPITSGGFSGTVNINGGTVTVGTGAVWSPTVLSVGTSGTFDLGGNNLTLSGITNAGIITNASSTPAILNLTNANVMTLGGTLTNGAGALSILKSGSGTINLTGTGAFTGDFVVNAGVVNVNTSSALLAGSRIVSNLQAGVVFGDGVTVAGDVVIGRDSSQAFSVWEINNGSVTFAGNMSTGNNSQFRVRVLSAGTATITGVWSETQGALILITQGNFVWDGTGSKFFVAPSTGGTDSVIGIGRSEAAGASRNTNIVLRNGAQWINTSVAGNGVSLGAAPANQTNAVQSLTVDHSSILIGALNFELAGQTTASNLSVIGGTIVAGSYTKTFNNSVTTFMIDGGLLQATTANALYIPAASNLVMALGTGGAFIDTQGFSLGIGAPFSNANRVTLAGGITFLGNGPVSFNGSGATYNGVTKVNTTTLYAGADNVFSYRSLIKVYDAGVVQAGGFSQSVGGLDDQDSVNKGQALGFNTLTLSPQSPNVNRFDGTLTANALGIAGSGTQILTNTILNWAGATTLGGNGLGGGKLIMGSALTNGFTINSSSLGVGAGDNTLVWWKGTAASAGLTAASLTPRQTGGVGNFVVADGTNGVDNFIKVSGVPAGYIDQGTFFNGADYAYMDSAGFLRAPVYGGADAGFDAANALTGGTHVLVTGADTLAFGNSFNTIKVSGTGSLNQAGNQITLTNSGILKSGGGSGSISGGSIQPGAIDLIVRADAPSDVLDLNSIILDGGGTGFFKAGAGVVRLGGANTFTGKTTIYNGTLALSNPLALLNSTLVYGAASGPLAFAGISAATLTNIQNASNDAHDLLLTNDTGGPVALTINLAGSLSLFNLVTGIGSLIKDGPGSLTLLAPNTLTGGVTLLAGTLTANGADLVNGATISSLGSGPLTIIGGIFRMTTGGDHSQILINPVVIPAGANGQINTAGTTAVSFGGNLSGSGTITRSGGSGVLNFTGTDNSGFHGTFINTNQFNNVNGIAFSSLSALPATDSTWILNATFSMAISATASSTIGLIMGGTVSGSSLVINNVNTSGSITTTLNLGPYSSDTTFAGNIVSTSNNAITVVKLGPGKLSLQGVSNFGGVNITSGILSASTLDNGVLGATSAAAALGATTLVVASTVGLVTNMTLVGTGLAPGSTITAINGTTLTLSRATTAAVTSGTVLQAESNNALGVSGGVSMAAGSTLQYAGTGNSTVKTLTLAGSATLDASGTGAVNFANTASISYSSPGAVVLSLSGNSTAPNVLATRLVNNGTSSLSLNVNGTGLWTINNTASTYSGGTTIAAGQLMITNATGNALGTGAVNINSGGTLAGSGFTTANINVNSGGHMGGGGVSINNHLGTINLGGTLTLATGSILDFDMSLPGSPNDVINFFGTASSMIIPAVASAVSVNLYNSNLTTNYFYNGTYNLFTGILAGNTASISTALTAQALKVVNEPAGPTFVFSLATGDPTRLIITVNGAWNNATWTNGGSDSQWTNAGTADWTGGIPNGSGHIANFVSNITAAQNITMVGGKTLTNLNFNSTFSFSITGQSGSDTLTFMGGSANGSLITVATGSHTINAPISIGAATLTVNAAASSSVLQVRDISGGGSLALTGGGSLVIAGNANYSGGTSIAAASKLVVGNGSTGTLSGLIDNGGNLIFNHTDNVNFAVSNLVQTSTTGTLTNAGTGVLTLQGLLSGTASSVLVPGPIVVNAGTVKFDTDYMTNGNGTTGNTSVTLNANGILDLNGHSEQIRAFNNSGTLTNSGGAGTLFLSAAGTTPTQTSSGIISGSLSLIKDGSNNLTISGGTVNNTSLTIVDGQVIFTNTNSTALSGQIIMARSNSASAGLILGSGVNVSTSALISVYNFQQQGNVEFVSPTAGSTATFSGNVNVDTANNFGQQIRIGNANTSGTMVYSGSITVPNNVTGLVTRNNVTLAGSGLILDQNQFSTFNIGTGFDTAAAAVNFNMTGNSQLLTSVADDNGFNGSVGLRLGNSGTVATATSTHTISGNAFVRVGLNGASVYDLQPSSLTASTMSNTLNLNGGSIALSRFYMQGAANFGGGFGSFSQANVNFNGGTVIAGLSNNDMTMGPGSPYNLKFTVQAGGLVLDLNGKSNVQWSKPLTSGAPTGSTAAAFTDGGVKYVSNNGASSITLSTRQLYAGPTTIGGGATVIAGSSDVLGNPAAAAAVNFSGGVLKLSQSFVLASVNDATTNLTHRFSFNDSSMLDAVTNSPNGQLNANATANGVLSMTSSAASATASILNVGDIGGTNTNYTASGVSFAVWYTPATQGSNAVLFSIGQNSPFSAGSQVSANPTNYFMLTVASGSATGNIRAMLNVGGGEISASSSQPAAGAEHLAVVTIDSSNLAVFVDGVLTQRVALSTLGGGDVLENLMNGGGIYLGGSQFAADPSFNGSINEFRVYNTVLNNAYITALKNAGANALAAAAALNRNITVDANGGTLALAGFRLDVGGNMTGAGTLTLQPGTLALTGNSAIGLVIPNGAKLLVGTGASGGALTAGTITNSDEIVFNNSGTSALGAAISGGTVTFNGSGTTTVSAANLPQVNLNAGNLMLASSVNVTGLFTVAGGTGLGFTLGTAPSVLSLAGGYSHTGGALNVLTPGFGSGFDAGEYTVLTGAGTSLAGQFNAPAPAGGWTFALDTSTTGSLAIIVTSAWFNQLYWRSANADANWTNNSNWSATSALDVSNASGSPLGPTTVIFNSTAPALVTLTTASVAHDLSFTGSGNATIGGTASGASLQLLGANAITVGAGAGAVTVNPAGGLLLNAATITNNGTSGLTLGTLLGASLTLAGAGLTTLLTANTFTAGVNIAAGGNVKIANAGALGANALNVDGTLDLNGLSLAPANFSGGATGVITNNATAASTFTFNPVASVQTYSGHFAGNLALTKNGSGTLVLSGSSSHTGTTTVGAGKLLVGANNALSANSLLSLAAATTLDMNGFNATTGGLTGPATALITNSGATPATLAVNSTAGASTTFSGILQDGTAPLALVATGTGQLALGSANTFTGGVSLLGGTLSATNPTAGSTTASLGTGVLTLTGGTFRGQPSGNNSYVLANNILANGNANFNTSGSANATLTGNLSGSGTLIRNGGNGALIFAGADNSGFHGLLVNESGNSVGNLVFVAPGAYPAPDFKLTQNSTNSALFQTTTATTVSIGTLAGNSPTAKVTIDSGTNVVATTLSVGANGGNSTYLGLITSNSNNTMTLQKTGSGSFTLGGSSSAYTGTGPVNVSGGTLAFGATAGTRHTSAVLLQASAATVASGATLDLTNHDLLIHGGNAATIESLIGSSYFFGLWNKPGITSSSAQSNPITTLGIMSGADYNTYSPTPGVFDGVPVANTDIVVKYTYSGDINLDGLVNDDDFGLFSGAYFFTGVGNYALGDLNFDGLVNDDDFGVFSGNYFFTPPSPLGGLSDTSLAAASASGGSSAPVPEPASLVLLGLGATALLSRRKNRKFIVLGQSRVR